MTNWKDNLLAGHSIFTVTNTVTNKHFTYRIIQPHPHTPHFVSLLTGPNNEEDYTFIGTIFQHETFRHSSKGGISRESVGVKGFEWLWRNLHDLPSNVRVDNAGYCFRCGKLLTTPESVETGFGPTCTKIIQAEKMIT